MPWRHRSLALGLRLQRRQDLSQYREPRAERVAIVVNEFAQALD
jgi:hypothetical protein